jgi:homoserine kinase type II
MAVFTPITHAQLAHWLQDFDLGNLLKLEGIASGIENTNYFVTTDCKLYGGQFVLTIFEKLTREQLPFYLEFMRTLAQSGVNVPLPVANHQGQILHSLDHKPCALATRLEGEFELDPMPEHCRQVGVALARMHEVGLDYQRQRPDLMLDNPRGLPWWQQTLPLVLPHIPPMLQQLLAQELRDQTDYAATPDYAELTRGPVHADLFRNNVLFAGSRQQPRLGGFIDFYFAGVDTWLFDLAVTVNDWCIDPVTGVMDAPRYEALLRAYAEVRPFSPLERRAWPMLLRAAALRFWMSRLYDFYLPRAAETLTPHDPSHFERVLLLRRLHNHPLP